MPLTLLIGVTCDLAPDGRYRVKRALVDAMRRGVERAGAHATPVILPPVATDAPAHAAACAAFVFSGGDDPRTERYGEPTHPKANPVHPERQAYEEALLRALDDAAHAHKPVLGVCLGMQMMALHRGGSLIQHMPDEVPTHSAHIDNNTHAVAPVVNHPVLRAAATVTSWHRQCVRSPGALRIVARALDGVIEAIDDPARPFYLGVQWHPERTKESPLGDAIFEAFVAAAAVSHATSGANSGATSGGAMLAR